MKMKNGKMMNNVHAIYNETAAATDLVQVTVVGRFGSELLVSVGGQTRQIRCAASCLLTPNLGDTVLVALGQNDHSSFVLSVLLQADDEGGDLLLPGGTVLKATKDQFEIESPNLRMTATKSFNVTSPLVLMKSYFADLSVDFLRAKMISAESHISRMKGFAGAVSWTVNRMVQKVRNSVCEVDELMEVRAGRQRTTVEGACHTQARHVSMTAEGSVKIDGEKIDLG
jgi:hypothetical protein